MSRSDIYGDALTFITRSIIFVEPIKVSSNMQYGQNIFLD
jgi:hypothetical protein